MRWRLGLRARLTLGALALAVLAVAAAGLAVYGLARTQALAAEALAAQRRIEAYGTLSSRVNEWMLGWLAPAGPPPDATKVMEALAVLDRLVGEDVAAARSPTEAAERVRLSATPARIRAQVGRLAGALADSRPGSPAGEAAAYTAAQIPALTAAQVQQETRRRDEAMAAMDALRRRLHVLALAVGLAAPLVLAGLYLWVLRPLFARLAAATASAEALGAGDRGGAPLGHDELGLLLARLRRVAARVTRERARLEATVAERTAALSHANARLARADAERRRFFADVGHELRTPLTVILGEAELGARHPDGELRASFGTIRSRALRLVRRIEDLLRVARSESGQLELERGPVDLADVASAAMADAAPLLARAGLSAREEAMPRLVVIGDTDWLRQVLAGFLENAAKYAGRGAEVTIAGRAEAGWGEVVVADDGPGLAPEALGTLFDRFSRGAEGTAAPGFGVGLALARWVVEAHGGSLRAEAAEGGGLRLVLRLPLATCETGMG
ncbi:MAG TPA: HAMP domain-containing sensor histidine kinase [Amaricoccus sp.]|nr:HAMP domain-containing sensor histidine kinase [Amaricoccus sp.]